MSLWQKQNVRAIVFQMNKLKYLSVNIIYKLDLNVHSIIQQDIIMDGCQNEDSGNLLVVVAIKPVCVLWKTVQIGVQCMTINKWEHSS